MSPFAQMLSAWLDELLGLPDGEVNAMWQANHRAAARQDKDSPSPADVMPPERSHAHGSIAVPLAA